MRMRRLLDRSNKQAGAALLLFLTVLVMGVAWYTVVALAKAAPSAAEQEIRTGVALNAAKQALLSHAALYAARTDHDVPGRLPCPEPLSPASGAEGDQASTCSNASTSIGRLPWRALGVDQIRDGDGELLWYVLGPNFRSSPINFGTPGGLMLDADGAGPASGAQVVALIIAPGGVLNTSGVPGPAPADCSAVNQQSNRYAKPFDPGKFLECGRHNAGTTFAGINAAPWTNDRIIAITAAEVMDAIAGAVADRLQRQVAPVLASWEDTEQYVRGKSWKGTWSYPYLPYASAFTNPATNDLCGDAGSPPTRAGLPPIASLSAGTCFTNWSGTTSALLGIVPLGSCEQWPAANSTHLRCRFQRLLLSLPPFSVRITATAPRVAGAFRGTWLESDVLAPGSSDVDLVSGSFSATSGAVTAVFDVTYPLSLGVLQIVEVYIPNLPDPVFLTPPPSPAVTAQDQAHEAAYEAVKWFLDNDWARYTYYAVAPGATREESLPQKCPPVDAAKCLSVNGGATYDKRLVLTLMGPRATGSQSQPSSAAADYLESHTPGTRVFTPKSVNTASNDRITACPSAYTPPGVTICD